MAEPLHVVSPTGEVGTIDAKEAAEALHGGYRLATPGEVHHAQLEARYGGTLGGLGAAAAGGARGLTLGLSDPLALGLTGAVGGKEAEGGLRDALSAYKEIHPYISTGSEIAGAVAPILLSGGSGAAVESGSLARTALTTAGSIPRGVAAVGGLVERGVASVVGHEATGLAGKLAQKVIPLAAGAATEGVAYGAGGALSEAALGDDYDHLGEKMLAGAGHGALLAGGGAGALGAAGTLTRVAGRGALSVGKNLLERIRPQDVEALATRTFGEAAPGIGEAAVKLAAAASGKDADIIRKFTIGEGAKENRRIAAFDAPKIRDEVAREFRPALDAVMESNAALTDETRGALKASYVRKAVKTGNEVEAEGYATDLTARVRTRIQGMVEDKGFGLKKELAELLELGGIAEKRIADAGDGAGANGDMFSAIDDYKRAIGRVTKNAQAIERTPSPLKLLRGRATRDELQGIYEDVRKSLENEEIWGKAAVDQTTINKAWTKQIEASRQFQSKLTVRVRDPENLWADKSITDPAKVETYLSGLTSPKNDLTHGQIKQYLEGTRDLADAIGKSYELPAGKAEHVAKVTENVAKLGGLVEKAETSLTLANQLAYLQKSDHGSLAGVLGGLAVGGHVGGAVGLVAHGFMNPGSAITALASVERLASKVDGKIGTVVTDFFKEATGQPGRLAESIKRTGAARAIPIDTARTREPLDARYQRRVAQLAQLSSNPDLATERLSKSLAGIATDAPKTAAATTHAALRATQFLTSKVPANQNDFRGLTPQLNKPSVPDADKAKFLRYVEAVDDPTKVLQDMRSGKLTREHVEALRVVYPKIFAQLQSQVQEHLTSAKVELPYQQRVQLAILLGVPADATLEPKFVQSMQAAFAPPTGGPGGGAPAPATKTRPIKVPDIQTPLQRVAAGGGR